MKTPKKRGRKTLVLDWDLIASLAQIQCTSDEIAFICKVTTQTLRNHSVKAQECTLEDFLEANRQGGKVSLRRLQWDSANGKEGVLLRDDDGKLIFDDKGKPCWKYLPVAPNASMQIFLGKNWLGQTDKVATELTGKDRGPVQHSWVDLLKVADGNTDTSKTDSR
ncbi:MAG: hypothetical protein WC455_15635 [Dehalococcoidia bacterium]|jgi:hypothetical protein